MNDQPKVAFYWCASCGGCEESIVDLAEDLLAVTTHIQIVFWPCAMDFKRQDLEALPDGELTATFLNGAIRTDEQEEMARLLRRKSQLLVAYGACAHLGGIPGLANQSDRETMLQWYFHLGPSTDNPQGLRPRAQSTHEGHTLHLPQLHATVRSLDQVVPVDYYLPGCPPTPKLTRDAIEALIEHRLPPRGAVLAPDTALCDQCPRRETKPDDVAYSAFHRPHQVLLDPNRCFLAQGVVCLGPATRAGCEAQCVHGHMPCTGCFGPTSRVRDQGAKMLSSLAANVAASSERDIDLLLEGIPDPVGTLYRYGLARSILRENVRTELGATPAPDSPSPPLTPTQPQAATPPRLPSNAPP